jgi:hypothetical protein
MYLKWNRVLVGAFLESSSPAGLFTNLESLRNLLKSSEPGTFPNQEILWIAISIWNKGTEFFSLNDHQNGKIWMELALSMLPYVQPCAQVDRIRSEYNQFMREC